MELLAVVLILIVWAVYGIYKKATPNDPPIENMEEHLNQIMRLSTPQERRRFIRQDAARRRAAMRESTENKQ